MTSFDNKFFFVDIYAVKRIERKGDVSVVTRHEDPEWRHDI